MGAYSKAFFRPSTYEMFIESLMYEYKLQVCYNEWSYAVFISLIPESTKPDETDTLMSRNNVETSGTVAGFLPVLRFPLGTRESAVGIATGYGLADRGVRVRVPVGSRIFSSPRCPDQFWGQPNLLPNGYRGLFPRR
jgi:hypothetical protein